MFGELTNRCRQARFLNPRFPQAVDKLPAVNLHDPLPKGRRRRRQHQLAAVSMQTESIDGCTRAFARYRINDMEIFGCVRLQNFRRAGVLKKRSRTSTDVPSAAASRTPSTTPPSTETCAPSASRSAVFSTIRKPQQWRQAPHPGSQASSDERDPLHGGSCWLHSAQMRELHPRGSCRCRCLQCGSVCGPLFRRQPLSRCCPRRCIFEQFLDHRGRTLDNLTGGNFVLEIGRKYSDARHASFYHTWYNSPCRNC